MNTKLTAKRHNLTPAMLGALLAMYDNDGTFRPITARGAGVTEATMTALRRRGLVKLGYSYFATTKHGRNNGYKLTMVGAGIGLSVRHAERATH